jgi:hypothetical protein
MIEPADPDCQKCGGTGTVVIYEEYGKYHGNPGMKMASSGFSSCDCRKYENRKKIQDRCEHKFVCEKCGKHSCSN